MRSKTYYCYNHQKKGSAFANALEMHNFTRSVVNQASIVLSDNEVPVRTRDHAANIARNTQRFFVYPHSARPTVIPDIPGLPSSPQTSCTFVSAEGHREVMRAYGYDKPIVNAGWSFCPITDFKPSKELRKVLFAPIHPNANTWLSEVDKKINKATFDKLYALQQAGKIDLSVRHIMDLQYQGLYPVDGVQYIAAEPDLSWQSLDYYDLIVGHQTFAFLSVARGKPTLMMAEETPPHNGKDDASLIFVANWDKYKHLMMYPLDILAVEDVYGLMEQACQSDEKVREWKSRMIGTKEFDDHLVVRTILSYLT